MELSDGGMLLTLIPPVVIVLVMQRAFVAAWSIVRNKMAGLKLQAVTKAGMAKPRSLNR